LTVGDECTRYVLELLAVSDASTPPFGCLTTVRDARAASVPYVSYNGPFCQQYRGVGLNALLGLPWWGPLGIDVWNAAGQVSSRQWWS